MKQSTNNILGVVGLFATAVLTVMFMTALFLAPPPVLPFLHTPLDLLLELLSGSITGSREKALSIAYWLYLIFFALLSIVFGWAFWVRTSLRHNATPTFNTFLLVLQMLIPPLIHPEQPLAILVAAELAFVLPRRTAFYWLGAQMLTFSAMQIPILLGFGNWLPALDLAGGILNSCLTLVWFAIAFGVGYLASAERRGRIKLAIAHAELLATQQLLTDTLRVSERVRTSRNLHDAIGHHLTALNLHLDLGLRQSGAQALESFQLSSQLAQSLLEEVRAVVNIDREDQIIELRHALETLCSGIPVPRIALAYDEAIELSDPAVAHVIFRSVQEAITNAVRHSGAAAMEIGLQKKQDGVAIVIDDNGKGLHPFEFGCGLRSMRERIQALSGTLNITNLTTGGCRLQIWLPKLGGAL